MAGAATVTTDDAWAKVPIKSVAATTVRQLRMNKTQPLLRPSLEVYNSV